MTTNSSHSEQKALVVDGNGPVRLAGLNYSVLIREGTVGGICLSNASFSALIREGGSSANIAGVRHTALILEGGGGSQLSEVAHATLIADTNGAPVLFGGAVATALLEEGPGAAQLGNAAQHTLALVEGPILTPASAGTTHQALVLDLFRGELYSAGAESAALLLEEARSTDPRRITTVSTSAANRSDYKNPKLFAVEHMTSLITKMDARPAPQYVERVVSAIRVPSVVYSSMQVTQKQNPGSLRSNVDVPATYCSIANMLKLADPATYKSTGVVPSLAALVVNSRSLLRPDLVRSLRDLYQAGILSAASKTYEHYIQSATRVPSTWVNVATSTIFPQKAISPTRAFEAAAQLAVVGSYLIPTDPSLQPKLAERQMSHMVVVRAEGVYNEPVNPTDPTNPDPTDPTNPTDPTDPNDPSGAIVKSKSRLAFTGIQLLRPVIFGLAQSPSDLNYIEVSVAVPAEPFPNPEKKKPSCLLISSRVEYMIPADLLDLPTSSSKSTQVEVDAACGITLRDPATIVPSGLSLQNYHEVATAANYPNPRDATKKRRTIQTRVIKKP